MNIKIRLLSTVAAAALVTGFVVTGARAADVVAEPAAYDWSGLYFGAHVGYGEAYMDGQLDTTDGAEDVLDAGDLDLSDVIGGVHLGYNAQWDSIVAGIEGDFTWVGLKDHVDDENPSGTEENDHINGNVDFLASIRARLGLAMDNLLIFATGGVAFTEADIVAHQHGNHDQVKFNDVGGVVGGGVELAVAPNISIRAEGLYYFFGDDEDISDFHSGNDGEEFTFDDAFIARVGASIHLFGHNAVIEPTADVIAEPAAHDWSGLYFGAHVGYGEAYMNGELDTDGGDDDLLDAGEFDLSDVIGGVHLGYNAQWDSIVVGVEGDFTWVGLEDHLDADSGETDDHIDGKVDYLASIRARLGLAMDDVLVYATGGIAFTEAEIKADQHNNRDKAKFNDVGGVVGGGLELAVADNVSVRAEGLYYFFGDDVDISDFHSADDGEEFEFDDAFVVRVGASFHLGSL
jgi:outer membrane immunogenic protein